MKYDLKQILCLDIETVPEINPYSEDWEAYPKKRVWIDRYCKELKVGDDLKKHYRDKAALFPEFSKIVCISLGYVGENNIVKTVSYTGEEIEILLKLKEVLVKSKRTLSGFNIKGFDLPFIKKRMVMNSISIPISLNFESLKPREIEVFDIIELWKMGDRISTSLDVVALSLGIESPKEILTGDKVKDVWQNDIELVKKYCEADVRVTLEIALKILPFIFEVESLPDKKPENGGLFPMTK